MGTLLQIDPIGKKSLFFNAGLLVCAIFLIGVPAQLFYWYWIIWWFDMPMHFFGGVFIGLMSSWIFLYSSYKTYFAFIKTQSQFFIFGLVCVLVVGIGWEVFEYMLHLNVFQSGALNILDSTSDLFLDTAGGLTALLFIDKMYLSYVIDSK